MGVGMPRALEMIKEEKKKEPEVEVGR